MTHPIRLTLCALLVCAAHQACVPSGGGADGPRSDGGGAGDPDGAACMPACGDRACGPDGCGGACGACRQGAVCDARGACADGPAPCDDGACAPQPADAEVDAAADATVDATADATVDATVDAPVDEGPDGGCIPGAQESDGCPGGGERVRVCVHGRWSEWPECPPPACGAADVQAEPCGLNGRGERTRGCEGDAWGAWTDCRDPDVCADEALEREGCGLNVRGERIRRCEAGRWSDWAPCDDDDVCVDGREEARTCGRADLGDQRRLCAAGQWGQWSPCDHPDVCEPGLHEARLCGLNRRGEEGRDCFEGQWTPWGACADPDACRDGADEARPCGRRDEGQQRRRCADGQWGEWAACEEAYDCDGGITDVAPCGINLRGTTRRACDAGWWGAFGACEDRDTCVLGDGYDRSCVADGSRVDYVCLGQVHEQSGACHAGVRCDEDGAAESRACGRNGRGEQVRICDADEGFYGTWRGCLDPDRCTDDDLRQRACGQNDRGIEQQRCVEGRWSDWSACDDPDVCRDGGRSVAPCGEDGTQRRACRGGQWVSVGDCSTACHDTAGCPDDHACRDGRCIEVPRPSPCRTAAECGNRQMCIDGGCRSQACADEERSTGCPAGGRCSQGRCVAIADGSPCLTWSDCGMWQLCRGGACVTDMAPERGCDDQRCVECRLGLDTNHVCANGHCLAADVFSSCQADFECGADWYCGQPLAVGEVSRCQRAWRAEREIGEVGCLDGYALDCDRWGCHEGGFCRCRPAREGAACDRDVDCLAAYGHACVHGRCVVADGGCEIAADCDSGDACADGRCVQRRGRACETARDCGDGDCCLDRRVPVCGVPRGDGGNCR